MTNSNVWLVAVLLLLSASCTTIAPSPRDHAPDPGQMVSRKPVSEEVLAHKILGDREAARPDAGEILMRLEEHNQLFNERIREVMSTTSRRVVGEPFPSGVVSGDAQPLDMNFYDADLLEVIRLFMSLLDANYMLHPQVTGRVSLSVSDLFRPDQLLDLLEGILRINGMAMVQNDGIWEIMPLGRVPSHLSRGRIFFPDDGLTPRRGQMIQAYRLHFIPSSEMTAIIKPYVSEAALVYAHDLSGVMLVCDYPHNLARVSQLIEIFDESVFAGIHVATYTLMHVQAEDMVKELDEVAKVFGLGGEQGGLHARVSFLALARLNKLLALARDEQVLEFVEAWVRELDRELPSFIQEQYGEGVYVYYVQYGDAAEIVSSLQGLFEYTEPVENDGNRARLPGELARESETAASDGTEGASRVITDELPPLIRDTPFPTPPREAASATGKLTGPVTFVVDEPNNAVLMRCNTVDYPKILAVIEKLDQYPRQVLIEVVIAEVQLTEDTRLGMEWQVLNYRDGVFQSLGMNTGIGGIFETNQPSISSGLSYVVSSTERLRAALKASAADGHARILSTPTLLASDNKPAVINIGEEVPIVTSRLTRLDDTDPVRRSQEATIQYRDTGIILKVTPKINRQGMVRMEISQEVSSARFSSEPGLEGTPFITTRHASTHAAVNDQQTIVIGGLMRQEQDDSTTGIPGLSRLPVLKYLFAYERKRFVNSELMLFITPHVVRDMDDSAFITRDFLQRLERIKAGMR
ncbi:type II secretion system secretin GspD [Desulfonatronum thioautotrophicum]|uniref:type II secretion system secretin GspD n=1 Tax=Desulfonatronum thioautotrophicum TaxID=617001 RepID=UPI0005EB038A|nr:type II secretion system secretin GspD [Desulfonatronum thioautotrophicum]